MGNYIESSGYNNSYGSINALDNWNLTQGFFQTDVISHNPSIGGIRLGRGIGDGEDGAIDIGSMLAGSGGTIALLAVGWIALLSMGEGNKSRKREIRTAKENYRKAVAKTKKDYGFLGYKHYL